MSYCDEKRPCHSDCGIAIIVGLIFGIVVGVLFALNRIFFINISIWIVLSLGVFALLMLFIGALTAGVTMSAVSKCMRKNLICLIISIFGTIISALIALSIILFPFSLFSVAIVGITAFFFAFMMVELISLIWCFVYENRYPREG